MCSKEASERLESRGGLDQQVHIQKCKPRRRCVVWSSSVWGNPAQQ